MTTERTTEDRDIEIDILRAVLLHAARTFRANRFALILRDADDYLALERKLQDALAWTKPDGAPASHVAARDADEGSR